MTEILIKRSLSAGAEPDALLTGELAVNIIDKKIWIGGSTGSPVLIYDASVVGNYLPLSGGTMTGGIELPFGEPSLLWIENGVQSEIVAGGAGFQFGVGGFAALTINKAQSQFYAPLLLSSAPTDPLHATNKDYVDTRIAALGIPTPQVDKLGGVYAAEAPTGQTMYGIATSGMPIFKEIAVPYPAAAKLGGVYSTTAQVGKYVSAINPDGTLAYGDMPAGVDLSAYLRLSGGTMTGAITVPATMDFIVTKNGFGLYDNAATFLIRKGGESIMAFGPKLITSTVPVKLPADPVNALEAATKQYVDNSMGTSFVRKSGDVMSGPLRFSPSSYSGGHNGTDAYFYLDTAYFRWIMPSGKQALVIDPSTALVKFLSAAPQTAFVPAVDNDLTNKKYVDGVSGNNLPLAGGTMTGTIKMPTAVAGFQFGATGYNVFGASGGVAIRSNTTNIVTFTGANITNGVPMITPGTGTGVQFGSGGATLSRGSASTKIASSGMIELPTTAPAAGEAVRKDYVDARVIVTAVGAAAPATTGLSNGALWIEA
jgi:hypothetical protein